MTRPAPALLAAVLLSVSCTANAPHRVDAQGRALAMPVQEGELATKEGREKLATSSLEVHDTYELAFLEFDDQGNLFSRAPLELLIRTLQAEAARPERERLTLVLFAHGWQNDARLCNDNACCFRSLLARIASDAKQAEARSNGVIRPSRTIGIFVGWRGLSATVPPFRGLSFYPRKRAAHAVGQGELVEVLSFLDAYQKHLNEGDPSRCRLVILGHSFGGAMVYSAIANVLKNRIVDAKVRSVLGGEPARIAGFGDVVILANPAFEASLYAPLNELIVQYPQFVPTQRPVLVILASESDTTTRVLFRIGRWIGTLFQRTGPRSSHRMLVTTVGNYDPFVTHRADLAEGVKEAPRSTLMGTVENCECRLPMPEPSQESVDQLVSLLTKTLSGDASLPPERCPGVEQMGSVMLDCVADHPTPLWVVRTSNDVISGHSGFFTRPVTDVIRGLVAKAVLEAGSAEPTSAP